MTETVQLEMKVYSPWAFTENESEKAKINSEIYQEIKGKAFCVGGGNGYGFSTNYMVIKDKEYFNKLREEKGEKEVVNQIALIADGGNLCFGYCFQGNLSEHTDWQGNKYNDVYVIKIFTD